MPKHHLRKGLSYCLCDGKAVFMDLARDRYFYLPSDLEQAFLALAADPGATPDRSDIDRLIGQGILFDGPPGKAIAPASITPAVADLLGPAPPPPAVRDTIAALWMQAGIAIELRCCSLAAIVRRSSAYHGRSPPRSSAESDRRLRSVAAAFAATGLVVHAADRCLPRALALLRMCKREGLVAELVFGVRLNPFTAHCWVQSGDRVVIGGFEQARVYTPILRTG